MGVADLFFADSFRRGEAVALVTIVLVRRTGLLRHLLTFPPDEAPWCAGHHFIDCAAAVIRSETIGASKQQSITYRPFQVCRRAGLAYHSGKIMGMKKTLVVVGVLAILAGCASGPRPDAGNSSAPVATAAPPLVTQAEPSQAPVAAAAKPAESVAPSPAIVSSPTPTEVEKPMAPKVVKPAAPTAVAKVVKAEKPAQVKPTVPVTPKPMKPVVAATPPADATEPTPIAAATRVEGKLELIAGGGQALTADELGQAVVYFIPDQAKAKAKPGRYLIYTHNKQFEPASLVIPLGSTISFPNQDEILHNVFSVTPQSSFDLGIYGEGKSADYTFKKTGLVLINCNVHQSMQANVLVVDTPYISAVDKLGKFRLDNIPGGHGKLMVWHPRANVQEQALTVPLTAPVSLQLVLTKPRVVDHLNKERKSY